MSELISEAEMATEELAGEPSQGVSSAPAALAVSAGDFAALEERIHRAAELVRREREARSQAEARTIQLEARAEQAEAQLQAQKLAANQLDNELRALRSERDHVRQRVENLLKQLDTLEL